MKIIGKKLQRCTKRYLLVKAHCRTVFSKLLCFCTCAHCNGNADICPDMSPPPNKKFLVVCRTESGAKITNKSFSFLFSSLPLDLRHPAHNSSPSLRPSAVADANFTIAELKLLSPPLPFPPRYHRHTSTIILHCPLSWLSTMRRRIMVVALTVVCSCVRHGRREWRRKLTKNCWSLFVPHPFVSQL